MRTEHGGKSLQLACFGVGRQHFGIDVRNVRHIVRASAPTPLPAAPALIEGILELEGGVLPVADLGRVLGLGPVSDPDTARIAVVETDGLAFGLRVERAEDVLTVGASALEAPPALAARVGYDVLHAVVQRPGAEPVLVIALDALVRRIGPSDAEPLDEAAS